MKIALVHEFLNQLGGAERVLQNFLEIWPDTTLHVLVYDQQRTFGLFEANRKQVSFLNRWPLIHKFPKFFLPVMPRAIESFRFDDYDVVLSDSSSFAKGIRTTGLHICYCHTPTRFLWTEPEDYVDSQPYPYPARLAAKTLIPFIRRWDYRAAQRPDFFIANSVNVQNRIRKYYRRESVVIPPPVDTDVFHPQGKRENYFFVASRLEPYKKIELVVAAFNELGLPLKVAGSGTSSEKLRRMARTNVEFLGRISDEELRRRYSECQAFIFPAEEDAGIMVVEAQACGTPVIAYRAGGALETVKEGITGEFFNEQTASSLKEVIKRYDTSLYHSEVIRQHALQFDKKVFQEKIKRFVEERYRENRDDKNNRDNKNNRNDKDDRENGGDRV